MFRFTLLSDGSSDRALLPILKWLLIQAGVRMAINGAWADLRQLRKLPRRLEARILAALQLYPCEFLFVHRDAEKISFADRKREIEAAMRSANVSDPPTVSVIPIRMTEAWLLVDTGAIRRAARNPNGKMAIALPKLGALESIADPKKLLWELIQTASGLSPGRLIRFDLASAVNAVTDSMADFAPLRALTAFRTLEEEVRDTVSRRGWDRT